VSRENVEIIRQMSERFAAGDRVSWREFFAEDVVWDTTATTFPNAGLYEGHAGVERFFIDWIGTFSDLEFEDLEYLDAGDSVIAVWHWRGLGKTSGVETEATMFGVYDLRDGQITRFRQYETREEALAAAKAG
jgi:ketosteroid isomerase-like protein